MNSLDNILTQKPRPLPVFVAIDRSGSMSIDGKIDALNMALSNFIDSVRKEDSPKAEIQVALFSFGKDEATCDLPLTPISGISDIPEYKAYGRTPMGMAFRQMKEMIEDRNILPSRAYRPTIVLITDGQPTDEPNAFVDAMNSLTHEGRSAKAFRMAMAIGDDADRDMLSQFVSEPDYLVSGENARDIRKFFKYVTMSVTSRVKSQTPDQVPAPSYPTDNDILDF